VKNYIFVYHWTLSSRHNSLLGSSNSVLLQKQTRRPHHCELRWRSCINRLDYPSDDQLVGLFVRKSLLVAWG